MGLRFLLNWAVTNVFSDDETDMAALEASVRSIEKDGLVWGGSKLVPLGFGIRKLQINVVVEDDKISLDDLQEEIAEFEDYVQSTDIVSRRRVHGFWRQLSNMISLIGCHAEALKGARRFTTWFHDCRENEVWCRPGIFFYSLRSTKVLTK